MIGLLKKPQQNTDKPKHDGPIVTPGQLRLNNDLIDIEKDLPTNAKLEFSDPKNTMKMQLTVWPAPESTWAGAKYSFTVEVDGDYPHVPPKVLCHTKIFHPNIDLNGNVCLNILRADWKPVLNLNNVIMGVLYLFIEPNPNDPLNEEAAALMRLDIKQFQETVKRTLKGGNVKGEYFPKLI